MSTFNLNLSQLVAQELRLRGNKSVKSLFWNRDRGDLAVFARSHTAEVPKSFNYAPGVGLSVEEIADYVAERCEELNKV
jgi:hypothetical protein